MGKQHLHIIFLLVNNKVLYKKMYKHQYNKYIVYRLFKFIANPK